MKMLLIDLDLLERCQTETRAVLLALPQLAPGLKQTGIAVTAGIKYQTLRSFMSGQRLSSAKLRKLQDALIERGVLRGGVDVDLMTADLCCADII
jgi:hypothetical protein